MVLKRVLVLDLLLVPPLVLQVPLVSKGLGNPHHLV